MNFSPHAFSHRQLQYVVAVADSLSFNRAADECHVSQPSPSLQIAELERDPHRVAFARDIAGGLSQATQSVQERMLMQFRAADPDYAERVNKTLAAVRGTGRQAGKFFSRKGARSKSSRPVCRSNSQER